MGLDQPLPVQYLSFVANAVRGDFGRSFITHHPIADDVVRTLPATFELAIASLGLGVVFGAPAGILAGIHPRSALDRAITFVAALGLSVPVYWIGLMLIFIFAVSLHVLPTSGRGTLAQLVLPSISLSIYVAAAIARITRASMLEVLPMTYVRTATAKGLARRVVVLRHMLRNAAMPIVTVVGLQFGFVFGSAVLAETVFAWPGIGSLMMTAVLNRDYPLIRGCILVLAAVFSSANLIVDMLYLYFDPRLRRV
jgi:ABC-type dipeptide/oligopeptide/nickel transport system permease component